MGFFKLLEMIVWLGTPRTYVAVVANEWLVSSKALNYRARPQSANLSLSFTAN